jgi:hypothetical protein
LIGAKAMEVFEVKEKKGQVKLPGGTVVEIRIPSVFEAQKVQKALEEAKGTEAFDILKQFYLGIGLNEESLNFFGHDDFHRFFLFLLGEKKS